MRKCVTHARSQLIQRLGRVPIIITVNASLEHQQVVIVSDVGGRNQARREAGER